VPIRRDRMLRPGGRSIVQRGCIAIKRDTCQVDSVRRGASAVAIPVLRRTANRAWNFLQIPNRLRCLGWVRRRQDRREYTRTSLKAYSADYVVASALITAPVEGRSSCRIGGSSRPRSGSREIKGTDSDPLEATHPHAARLGWRQSEHECRISLRFDQRWTTNCGRQLWPGARTCRFLRPEAEVYDSRPKSGRTDSGMGLRFGLQKALGHVQ